MRFKTYGLYVRSQINANDEQGTWCCIEFPSFDDQLSHPLALDIRFVLLIEKLLIRFISKQIVFHEDRLRRSDWIQQHGKHL